MSLKIVASETFPFREEAVRVLEIEAKAIQALAKTIDPSFDDLIDRLSCTKGRIILTGIGKNGHIAKKISSTLSSIGHPSLFVHPAEADHGDLGMITKDDCVIALSNSGQTLELRNLISYLKRLSIFLVSITADPQSPLAKFSDYVLCLPPIPEACPLGLAPTTSTTMMLALGDAISLSLLKKKDLSKNDFYTYHPGGRLGFYLTSVGEKMHKSPHIPLKPLGILMEEAILEMTEKGFGCVGIVDNNQRLCGIITDGDLRRHMNANLLRQKVEDVMTSSPITINENIAMSEALTFMNERKVTGVFIVNDEKKTLGFLHIHDFLRDWRFSN